MGYHWSAYSLVLAASGVVDVTAVVGAGRRRGVGRMSLCVVLAAAAAWSFAYALELAASSSSGQELWGDLQYVGTTILPAAWLIFALQYTGRVARAGSGLLAVLAVEPLVVWGLLAYPSTRALVRSYPPGPPPAVPQPRLGVAYWPHFLYTNALVLTASALLLITMMRVSRLYRRQSITLLVAICLPLVANAMSSLQAAPFDEYDPSPVAVSLAGWVLVFGVLRYRLLDLRPVARTLVMETIRDAVFVVDTLGRVIDLNPAAQQLVGRKPATVIGCSLVALLGEQAGAVGCAEPGSYDVAVHAAGQRRALEVTVTPLTDPRGASAGRVLVLRDVTARRELEQDLRRLAHTDPLTGLPNRMLFYDRLEHALDMASRHGAPLAVLFLDLDRFKTINDGLGHAIGDKMLTAVAHRLRDCLRAEDTIARLGGDEFAVLLPEMSHPQDIRLVAAKLLDALAMPQRVDGHELTVDASIGVAVFPEDGTDARRLMGNADKAMYRAKSGGGGRVRAAAPAPDRQASQRKQLAAELRQALRDEQLQLVFQPYSALSTSTVVGYEALVRWSHPDRGRLPPASFLPVAEDAGLIEAVDRWVLTEACRQARQWACPLAVSVNVSSARLQAADLPEHITDVLTTTGLNPSRLLLEFGERTLFADEPGALRVLADLAATGVGLALDDFGAAYTTLGRLRGLPLSQVKIDRSLIAAVDDHGEGLSIAAAVIDLVHAVGLPVTAQGIERTHQLQLLSGLRCEYGQGFLLGRPHPRPIPTR